MTPNFPRDNLLKGLNKSLKAPVVVWTFLFVKPICIYFFKKKEDMTDVLYLTKEGLDELKSELKELKDTKRAEMAKRIKNAREMGDLSENAEYHSAKEEQAFVEGRISELEEIIKNSKVSEGSKDEVAVGSKVTVHIDGDEEVFHLVGAPEADPVKGKISHESPLGEKMMGKKAGEKFEVEAPIGKLTYTILKIH